MRAVRVATALAVLVGMQMPALAHAQTSQIASRAAISAATTLNWISLYGALDPILNPVASIPGTAGPLKVTVSGPGNESALQQSASWYGVFSPGDPVLFSAGSGTLRLGFSADIFAFGANVQSNRLGNFTGTIKAYDASNNLLGSYSKDGSYVTNESGLAPFLGIESTTGIRTITFDVSGNLINPDTRLPDLSLGINQATIATSPRTTVPEPGTYALTVAGLAGVLLVSRRRRRLNA